jgi:hypothetical protein
LAFIVLATLAFMGSFRTWCVPVVYPQIKFVWRVVVRVSAHAPCGHLRPSA